jgi:hypothetical protein
LVRIRIDVHAHHWTDAYLDMLDANAMALFGLAGG